MTRLASNKLCLDGKEISNEEQLVEVYHERIKRFGMSGETMFYKDEAQHQAKVAQFATILHTLITPNDTLLDIGCGYGSLVSLLPPCQYSGIDMVPEFIEYARKRYDLLNFKTMKLEDCKEKFDWCVLLGVVNTIADPEKVVELSWDRCNKGILVDFIDQQKMMEHKNKLNQFDIGGCLRRLLYLGARTVHVYQTDNVWTIFVATRQGLWLSSQSGSEAAKQVSKHEINM